MIETALVRESERKREREREKEKIREKYVTMFNYGESERARKNTKTI